MTEWNEAIQIAAVALGDRAKRDVPIGPLTTYKLGGPAALFIAIANEQDVSAVRAAVEKSGIPTLVVGKGSNLLVTDSGFPGLVITLAGNFAEIEIEDDRGDGAHRWVRAGGAVSLPILARKTAAAALSGLEWAVGVPGTVGGAVRMNAGGHGSQTIETLRRYRLVDLRGGEDAVRHADHLETGYRRSNVAPHHLLLWAEFELRPGDRAKSEAAISEIVRWRREHQPGGHNAGSVFINPPDDSAGRLIEEAGLRGHRLGSAYVSDKHANFIQSDEGGCAADVAALIAFIQREVMEVTGVKLEREVRLIGFTDEGSAEG